MKLFLCKGDIENAEKKRMDGAVSIKFDGITHGLESASLPFSWFFLNWSFGVREENQKIG